MLWQIASVITPSANSVADNHNKYSKHCAKNYRQRDDKDASRPGVGFGRLRAINHAKSKLLIASRHH